MYTPEEYICDALEPVEAIAVGKQDFLLCRPDGSGRHQIVAYTIDPKSGQVATRLFYKSKSGGSWRGSSGYTPMGTISKGGKDLYTEEYGQYTQATRVVRALGEFLDEFIERYTPLDLDNKYLMQELMVSPDTDEKMISSLAEEVSVTVVPSADAYCSGVGFRRGVEIVRRELEQMCLPDGFEPNFYASPIDQYNIKHSLLGKCQVEVFAAVLERRPVEWHMARHTETDTVWIDTIRFDQSSVTSYGTDKELILAGALNAKPIDYAYVCDMMIEGEDYDYIDDEYVLIKKTLDRIGPVRRYRVARGLV